MAVELFDPKKDTPFDFRKPIKVKLSKEDCRYVYEYLEKQSKQLRITDLTEMLILEKTLGILKKITNRILSYTTVRQLSFSITEAHAIVYLYKHFSNDTDHLTNLEFVTVFMQIDKQL